MSSLIVQYTRTYNIENRRATFLESNEAARLYFLHLLLGKSCSFSEIGLSVKLKNMKVRHASRSLTRKLDIQEHKNVKVCVQVQEGSNCLFEHGKMGSR